MLRYLFQIQSLLGVNDRNSSERSPSRGRFPNPQSTVTTYNSDKLIGTCSFISQTDYAMTGTS